MPSVPLLFGPMVVGAFLNAILYGVMGLQALIYYQTYKKDGRWIRFLIAYLIVVETVNTAFSVGLIYEPLVLRYATPHATTFFPVLLPTEPITTILISTPIQIFFSWRISIISRRIYIPIVICALAFISFGGGIWLCYTVVSVQRFAFKPKLHWPALMWLLASAIADVLITISLVVNLIRRKTGFEETDSTINKIIRMTVQTGLITAVFAVLDVVSFLTLGNTTLNFTWDLALSKLYTNALLSTLNARAILSRDLVRRANPTNVLFSETYTPSSKGLDLEFITPSTTQSQSKLDPTSVITQLSVEQCLSDERTASFVEPDLSVTQISENSRTAC